MARLLAADGHPQRLLVRNPEAAPDLPGVEIMVIPSYADGAACQEALEGVETLFTVVGPGVGPPGRRALDLR